jgi:hypothetical protein
MLGRRGRPRGRGERAQVEVERRAGIDAELVPLDDEVGVVGVAAERGP